ncbi:MAG: hypothetical protein J7L34_07370 [Thermotogaceae bacterium]|nr:hypothetical protein [Thermotogaceae bacterium]
MLEKVRRLLKAFKKLKKKYVEFYTEEDKIIVKYTFESPTVLKEGFYKKYPYIPKDDIIEKAVKSVIYRQLLDWENEFDNVYLELQKIVEETKQELENLFKEAE